MRGILRMLLCFGRRPRGQQRHAARWAGRASSPGAGLYGPSGDHTRLFKVSTGQGRTSLAFGQAGSRSSPVRGFATGLRPALDSADHLRGMCDQGGGREMKDGVLQIPDWFSLDDESRLDYLLGES